MESLTNPVGNLANVVYPSSSSLTMAYDPMNRLISMVDGVGATREGYDDIDQLTATTPYDPGATLTNRFHERFGYRYDAAGNLNYRTNNALVEVFNVNSLNELTTNTRSGTLTVAGTTTSAATNVTVNTANAFLFADLLPKAAWRWQLPAALQERLARTCSAVGNAI